MQKRPQFLHFLGCDYYHCYYDYDDDDDDNDDVGDDDDDDDDGDDDYHGYYSYYYYYYYYYYYLLLLPQQRYPGIQTHLPCTQRWWTGQIPHSGSSSSWLKQRNERNYS